MKVVVGLSVLSVSFLESSGKKGETSSAVNSWKKSPSSTMRLLQLLLAKWGLWGARGGTFFIFLQDTSALNTVIPPPHKTPASNLYTHAWSSLWHDKACAYYQNRTLLFTNP